jgi:hypothetical protein
MQAEVWSRRFGIDSLLALGTRTHSDAQVTQRIPDELGFFGTHEPLCRVLRADPEVRARSTAWQENLRAFVTQLNRSLPLASCDSLAMLDGSGAAPLHWRLTAPSRSSIREL